MRFSIRSAIAAAVAAFAFGLASPSLRALEAAPVAPTAAASTGLVSPAERIRLERLAALAHAWGEVRYRHPWLATRDIDWDRALVEAIPRVNAARDTAAYAQAVEGMLAKLEDPATHVVDTRPAPSAVAGTAPMVRSEAGGVVRVDFERLVLATDSAGSQQAIRAQLEPVLAAIAAAPAPPVLVLDARATRPPEEDGASPWVLGMLVQQLSPTPVLQGGLRYRRYDGYPSQTGSLSSGGYVSGMTTEAPVMLPGQSKAAMPPLVLVTNARSALPAGIAAGLLASGRARLVSEGGVEALGASPARIELVEGVAMQLRTTELVGPDGQVGLVADEVATPATIEAAIARAVVAARSTGARRSAAALPAPLRSDQDRPYADMLFPPAEYRLLALFRFWNVMERFFPYRAQIGPSWDDVLTRYIPQFEANADAADYQLTLRRLATEPHDSHVGIRTPMVQSRERLGRWIAPVLLKYVGEDSVVVDLLGEEHGLRIGDRLLRVDGAPVAEARAKSGQYVAASTPQAWQRDLHLNLLRGQEGTPVRLDVAGPDGAPRSVTLRRTVGPADMRPEEAMGKARPQPVFGVLPDGVGYVDLARLTPDQVDAMFVAIAGTRASIFDMRGYPNGTAWLIASRLGHADAPVGALFRRPTFDGRGGGDLTGGTLLFEQRVPKAKAGDTHWPGKVVMLVDERTQSQAEHTGLFFEAMTDVTFIGSPTAGANGDVTELVLPGGIAVSFSGHDVRHADGRQLQRLGLQPQVRVAPTIAGIVRGDDEVLDAARAWVKANQK
jgi:C-terminal processing protease CtpA/Prc